MELDDLFCLLQLFEVFLTQITQIWWLFDSHCFSELIDILFENILPVDVNQWFGVQATFECPWVVDVVAVSYTHLDVYKRQTLWEDRFCAKDLE